MAHFTGRHELGNNMAENSCKRVAILYPGRHEARRDETLGNGRFADLFTALTAFGFHVEPAVYHDDFCEEVREQLKQVDGVLVWVNPIEGGRDRSVLDSMLRDVAAAGTFVSAHPDVILKLGTKEVLYRTRDIGWGCDTHLYGNMIQMRRELPVRLASGKARVLKQYRGNGGDGVWKVELPMAAIANDTRCDAALPQPDTVLRVRHAKRGCVEEEITLARFFERCEPYFAGNGRMIDQEYQERLTEGMIRCYLVHDKVAGFGHQAINALFPGAPGAPPAQAPQPGPRFYHPATKSEFRALKQKLEQDWVPAMQHLLHIETESLPILWDCDFLLGPRGENGDDTHVLCEINVSSVAPYPESAVPYVCDATAARLRTPRTRRGTIP
ncbi:MAG: Cj0069 family protein [Thermoanaerobaculia bacterium]